MLENVERIDAIARGEVLKPANSSGNEGEDEEIITAIEQDDTITTVTISGLDDEFERQEIEKAAKRIQKQRSFKAKSNWTATPIDN